MVICAIPSAIIFPVVARCITMTVSPENDNETLLLRHERSFAVNVT